MSRPIASFHFLGRLRFSPALAAEAQGLSAEGNVARHSARIFMRYFFKVPSLQLLVLWVMCAGVGASGLQHARGAVKPKGPIYVNQHYRFRLVLPAGWEGYTVQQAEWDGSPMDEKHTGDSGPELTLRHPEWDEWENNQNIVIMIFTRAQWRRVERGGLIVSAAPFPPIPWAGTIILCLRFRQGGALLPIYRKMFYGT